MDNIIDKNSSVRVDPDRVEPIVDMSLSSNVEVVILRFLDITNHLSSAGTNTQILGVVWGPIQNEPFKTC